MLFMMINELLFSVYRIWISLFWEVVHEFSFEYVGLPIIIVIISSSTTIYTVNKTINRNDEAIQKQIERDDASNTVNIALQYKPSIYPIIQLHNTHEYYYNSLYGKLMVNNGYYNFVDLSNYDEYSIPFHFQNNGFGEAHNVIIKTVHFRSPLNDESDYPMFLDNDNRNHDFFSTIYTLDINQHSFEHNSIPVNGILLLNLFLPRLIKLKRNTTHDIDDVPVYVDLEMTYTDLLGRYMYSQSVTYLVTISIGTFDMNVDLIHDDAYIYRNVTGYTLNPNMDSKTIRSDNI